MPKHLIMRKKFPAALDYRRASGRCGRLPIHSELSTPQYGTCAKLAATVCIKLLARGQHPQGVPPSVLP